jgi:hypothetical protein
MLSAIGVFTGSDESEQEKLKKVMCKDMQIPNILMKILMKFTLKK